MQRKVTWNTEDKDKIKKKFHSKASHKLSEMLKQAQREGKKPKWIGNKIWNDLLEKWNMLVYR